MNRIFIRFILPILFLAAGCYSIFVGATNIRHRAVYTATTGVISHIESTYDSASESYDHDVSVQFTADGKEVEAVMGEYDASMYEGKEIDIYYDPDDPTKIIAASKTFPIVILSMGVVGILIGIVLFFRGLRAMP